MYEDFVKDLEFSQDIPVHNVIILVNNWMHVQKDSE